MVWIWLRSSTTRRTTGWRGGYEYGGYQYGEGGWYGYGGGAFPSDELPTGCGGYGYGGVAFPTDEAPTGGG
jgi:hypothetical protein